MNNILLFISIAVALGVVLFLIFSLFKLNVSIREIEKQIENMDQGDMNFTVNKGRIWGKTLIIVERLQKLKKSLIKNNFATEVVSNQISAVSQSLSQSMVEGTAFNQKLTDKAGIMTKLNENSYKVVNDAAENIKGIIQMLDSVKVATSNMEDTGEKSKLIVNESIQDINLIVDAVNEISESSKVTLERVNILSKTSEDIRDILNTVDEIAEQTNLLALNAAIESARAGEYGKGFGVVADEIRKLSVESKNAVSQIAALVEKITKEVGGVVAAIRPNMESVEKSVGYTKNVETSLNRIQECQGELQSAIEGILSTSKHELNLVVDMGDKILNVKNTYKEVNESVIEVYEAIGKQSENTKEMDIVAESLLGASQSLSSFVKIINSDVADMNYERFKEIAKGEINRIKENILKNQELKGLEEIKHKKILDEFKEADGSIEAIWTNEKNGRFIYSNPPAGIVNAKVRKWFLESIKGEEYISPAYISAITKNPCITAAIPIYLSDGSIGGVIGVDIRINA